jgi:hypothetical protein
MSGNSSVGDCVADSSDDCDSATAETSVDGVGEQCGGYVAYDGGEEEERDCGVVDGVVGF